MITALHAIESEHIKIDLVNLSEKPDGDLLAVIQDIIDDLELREDVRFLFQRVWTEITDDGQIIPNTARDTAFDGDSLDTNVVRVQISKEIAYPILWAINENLPGEYLRNVNFFNNEEEFFVYFAGHELRHLWQFQNEFKSSLINQLLEMDDECDADIYATRVLSRYREDHAKRQK